MTTTKYGIFNFSVRVLILVCCSDVVIHSARVVLVMWSLVAASVVLGVRMCLLDSFLGLSGFALLSSFVSLFVVFFTSGDTLILL